MTLHVGLDTFRPVKAEDPLRHKVHTEYFRLDPVTAAVINSTRREGGRIVAVGTTSVRTLEQAALWSEGEGNGEGLGLFQRVGACKERGIDVCVGSAVPPADRVCPKR